MDIIEIKKDFDWVLKVLESSTNNGHINTSVRLFDIFIEKWDWEISEEKKLTLFSTFNRSKTKKYSQLNILS